MKKLILFSLVVFMCVYSDAMERKLAAVSSDDFNPRSKQEGALACVESFYQCMNRARRQESPEGLHGAQCTCASCKIMSGLCGYVKAEEQLSGTELQQIRIALGQCKELALSPLAWSPRSANLSEQKDDFDPREEIKEPKPHKPHKVRHPQECFCNKCLATSNAALIRLMMQLEKINKRATDTNQVTNVNLETITELAANAKKLDKRLKNFSLLPKVEKKKLKKEKYIKPVAVGVAEPESLPADMGEQKSPVAQANEILVKLANNPGEKFLTPKLLIPGYEKNAKGYL